MADTSVATETLAPATGATRATTRSHKAKPTHPKKTSEMVNNAIREMKERNGSSLQAIKTYIAANYMVDVERLDPLIRKYLNCAVESGILIQTKRKDASGTLKLTKEPSANSSVGKSASGKKKGANKKKKKKPVTKKTATAKK